MAVLEKLRVRAGLLLAIIIGLALLAFVLSDLLDSSGSLFTRSKYEIAEVSGKSVPYTEYENKVKKLEDIQKLQSGQMSVDEQTMDQIRTVTWDNMIQDMILDKQYNRLGVEVSSEELANLIMGENPHPALAQLFTDPQTGILNRQALSAFLQRVSAEDETSDEKRYYNFLEDEIYRQRKNIKYLNLVRQGLYATKFDAERQQMESSKTADVNFIVKNFSTVSDSSIQVSKSDLEKYYKENKNLFKQSESRDLRYVYYEVVPSQADFKYAEQWINDIAPDFEKADNPVQFVNTESDVPFDQKNYKEGELSDTLNKALFNASVGASFGPYFTDNSYRISRLAAVNYLPDSVKARHILLRATQANAQAMFKLADSLATLVRKGEDFSKLALMYSSDNSAQLGGDVGWFTEGKMVKPFSDSCFLAKKGEVKVVPTQFGIHVIQVTDQSKPTRKVQVATLVKKVTASENTDHDYYMQANEFAGMNNDYDKFVQAVANPKGFTVRSALNVAPMDKRVNDMQSARQLVSWAYKAEKKDVSTVFKIEDRYVVATVENIREEGIAPLEEVKADVENRVKQEKKAETLVAQFNEKSGSAKSLDDLAGSMGLSVEPVSGIKFSSSTLGNAGVEPKVVAAALSLEKGVVSKPIIGENGVYVLYVNNVVAPQSTENNTQVDMNRNFVERNYAARTNYYAFEALKELAKVKDNRRMFY
ncbi:MAG TPA: SurA N-terminal domain-containing protein [Bacteroidales bacterium]|nr:SurA N-terminal domain-containing protein [Bacteroidales bacterium]